MDDLKPCPFCGAAATMNYHNGGWPDHCYTVGCSDWKCPSRSGGRASVEAARDLWNSRTRADDAEVLRLRTEVEMLTEALKNALAAGLPDVVADAARAALRAEKDG